MKSHKPNDFFEVATGVTCIELNHGKYALIDTAALPKVQGHRWCAVHKRNTWYAYSTVNLPNGKCTSLKMHRVILGAPAGALVDHDNGNGLDNRRENIALATPRQNSQNRHHPKTSRFPGVYLNKGKWRAQVKAGRRGFYLGLFDDEAKAADAYRKAVQIIEATERGAVAQRRLRRPPALPKISPRQRQLCLPL